MNIEQTSTDYRTASGAVGRIWQIRECEFGWAHPDGSEGTEETFEDCQRELDAIGAQPLPHWADMSPAERQAAWEAGQSRASDADGVQSMTTGFYGKGEV